MSGADPIGALEDAILARLRAAFTLDGKSALKAVATLEHPFDARTPASIALHAPGVFVVPLVARPTGTDRRLDLQWAVYCLSNAATPGARARGGTGAFGIGTYAIASRAVAALDGWLPETGTASALRVLGVENLTGLVLVKERMAVLAITLAGMIECEPGEDGTDLADFLTYHSDWDIAPFADPPDALPVEAPDATTTVTLEGASG